MTCYFLLNLLMVVQIRILDNGDHCLEMYGVINIILYITNQYLTNEQVIEIVLSNIIMGKRRPPAEIFRKN